MEAQRLCTRDECRHQANTALSSPAFRMDAGNQRQRRIHIAPVFESLIGIHHSRFANLCIGWAIRCNKRPGFRDVAHDRHLASVCMTWVRSAAI
jgi:hypothetical protein